MPRYSNNLYTFNLLNVDILINIREIPNNPQRKFNVFKRYIKVKTEY